MFDFRIFTMDTPDSKFSGYLDAKYLEKIQLSDARYPEEPNGTGYRIFGQWINVQHYSYF